MFDDSFKESSPKLPILSQELSSEIEENKVLLKGTDSIDKLRREFKIAERRLLARLEYQDELDNINDDEIHNISSSENDLTESKNSNSNKVKLKIDEVCNQAKNINLSEFERNSNSNVLVQRSVFDKEMTLLSEVETFNHKDKLNGEPVVLVDDIFNKSVIKNDIHLELKKTGKRMRKPLPRMSPFRKLNLFVYKGLLQIRGRLQQCPLPFNIRHPLILPNNHFVTDLIINEFHINNGYFGLSHVFADLRERFWRLRCHSAIRRVINKCIICKAIRARPCKQMMVQLLISRMEYGSCPFNSVEIDNFGPFYIKKDRSFKKRYGCLFTCLTIRAIHIEVAHTLDTDSFICAFNRFIVRRGCPKHIFSDNGSNFRGAEVKLRNIQKDWNQVKIASTLINKGCEWHFNPPKASYRGGVWERLIRSVRNILKTMLYERPVTDGTLLTFIVEAEGILNNRLIVKLLDDTENVEALTPNKLLLIYKSFVELMSIKDKIGTYNKRWKEAKQLADIFWKRWLREYIPTLQEKGKWERQERNLRVRDLVLVVDKNLARNSWRKAIIESVKEDGCIKTVKIKTTTGIVERDVRNLCLLEQSQDLETFTNN